MLPRSYSNGATQLRRVKSAPSVQRCTSVSSLIDPVAAKQHAIVAATIAYERSHDRECGGKCHAKQPARQRSNRAGRPEGQGSHFEASHALHRQSSKKLSATARSTNDNARPRRATVSSAGTVRKYNSNCHPRSIDVIEYGKTQFHEASENYQASSQHIRKSTSTYIGSGCAPATSIDAISFLNNHKSKGSFAPFAQFTEETLTGTTEQDITLDSTMPGTPPVPLTNSAIYRVDEKVAKARDHHLHQFQINRLRHRASTMLTPFKKRVGSGLNTAIVPLSGTSNNGVTYVSGRSPPAQECRPPQRNVTSESRPSKTLKSKIMGVFRKPSSLHVGLPVQQVHASRAHFGDLLSASSSKISTLRSRSYCKNQQNVGPASSQHPSIQPVRSMSGDFTRMGSPTVSEATMVTSTSRVTSWADSTISGTATSRDSHRLTIIHEDQQQPEEASLRSQKRKQSLSFFRRTPKSVAVKSTKPFPDYGTLNLHKADSSGSDDGTPHKSHVRKSSVDLASLPSQLRRASLSKLRAKAPIDAFGTVRIVSSSSQSVGSCDSTRRHIAPSGSSNTPALKMQDITAKNLSSEQIDRVLNNGWLFNRQRNRPQKVQETQTPHVVTPTVEQIASRVEKSNERWKEPLDEGCALFYSRSPPKVSRKLDQTNGKAQSSTVSGATSAEDIFQTVREPPLSRSMGVISPSIYSRNTNSASPQKRYCDDDTISLRSTSSHETGTAVIITSHPVVKYAVGSGQKTITHLAKTSRDWRDWISKEVEDLGTDRAKDLTFSNEYVLKPVDSRHRREHAQIIDGADLTMREVECEFIEPDAEVRTDICPPLPGTPKVNRPQKRPESQTRVKESTEQRPESHSEVYSESRPQIRNAASRYGPDDRPSSRLHDRPALRNLSASCMNERFPLIDTGRPPSRQRKASTPSESIGSRNEENVKPKGREDMDVTPSTAVSTHLQVPVFIAQPARAALRRPRSTNSFQRSKSSLAHYTTSGKEGVTPNHSPTRVQSHIPRPRGNTTQIHRPKSSLEICAASRRNRVTPLSRGDVDTDPTLVGISLGPYREGTASPKPLSVHKSASFYKENSPFANSSPARTMREEDGNSLPPTPTSGGQRLAEQFLNARRVKGEMRVSESPSTIASPMFL